MADTSIPKGEWLAYTVLEACEMLRISKSTFYEMKKAGGIRTVSIHGRVVVTRDELLRILEVAKSESDDYRLHPEATKIAA